jgi:hypothetical protein
MLDKNSESHVHVEAIEEPPPPGKSIAFGLERMGLIASGSDLVHDHSRRADRGRIFGIYRIKIDDLLSQLFGSDSKDYKQYEAVTKRFPATEFDVLVVVEGKTLLARENLEKIRDMVTDLQLVEACAAWSRRLARQAPEPGGCRPRCSCRSCRKAPPTRSSPRPSNPTIIRGKLLSEDGTLALIVLPLEPSVVSRTNSAGWSANAKIMADDLSGSGLNAQPGVPVMRWRSATRSRDGLTYNILAFWLAVSSRSSSSARYRSWLGVSVDHRDPARARRPGWAAWTLDMFRT